MTQEINRVLITGIKGFTGQYMSEALSKSPLYQVFGTGVSTDSEGSYHDVDLRDIDSLSKCIREVKPTHVVHLAALAFVGHGDLNAFYDVNLMGTRNLLSVLAGMDTPPKKVLIASSANVYGNAQEGVLTEQSKVMPANDYAVSKLSMEYMASLWMDKLPITIVRPFNYTGVGQDEKFLIPKIVKHFKQRADQIELGNIDVWRDFSDVRAVVSAYQKILESDCDGMTINVCSNTLYSLRDILSMCEEITGHTMKVKVNPAFVRQNEVKTLKGDYSLLMSKIDDWQPIAIENTLRWMLQS